MEGPIDTNRVNSIKDSNRKPFRILALDGGGVRAIMQATILKRLEPEFPNILDEVDMFAGASAGSIVSAAMSSGLSPTQTYDMWMQTAPEIFVEGYLRKLGSLDNAIAAAYDPNMLSSLLIGKIGNKNLGELKKKILIPSFHLDCPDRPDGNRRWGPEYFHNFPGSKWNDLPLMEAVLRSAAAPTYFPIRNGFVDGGTFANNPALAAVSTALANGIKLEDIVVLSISTGSNNKFISQDSIGKGNWGLVEWGPHIVDLLLDSGTESIDYTCNCLLQKQYFRLDPLLTTNIGLDDASKLPELAQVAEKVDLEPLKTWLNEYWKTTKENSPAEAAVAEKAAEEKSAATPKGYCAIM